MMLLTEQNTEAARRKVARAAIAAGIRGQAIFEHGQWWINNRRTGQQWAVNDATGPGTYNGFDFECVRTPLWE